jgi:hypothetical protein
MSNAAAIESRFAQDTEQFGEAWAAKLREARQSGQLDKVLRVQRELGEAVEAATQEVKAKKKPKQKTNLTDEIWNMSPERFEKLSEVVESRRQVEWEAEAQVQAEYAGTDDDA